MLTAMVCGAIKTSKSYLHALGDGILQDIDAESRVKKVKRWLLSEYNNYDVSFLPHIEPIMTARIAQNQEMVFAIDGSEAGQGCTVLMISLTMVRLSPLVLLGDGVLYFGRQKAP